MRVFFTTAVFFALLKVFAQNTQTDSLAKAIEKMPQDTNRVLKTNDLASMTMGLDPKKAYDIAVEALSLAEKLDYKSGQALSYKTLG